jgi:hypothetical protein
MAPNTTQSYAFTNTLHIYRPVPVGIASWKKQQLCGSAEGFYLLPLFSSRMHIYQGINWKITLRKQFGTYMSMINSLR